MHKRFLLILLTLTMSFAALSLAAQASASAADPFPPADPKFFDTPSPSAQTVESFLKAIWGYDPNRLWRVEAIQKTPAPGVSKVTVFVTDKSQGGKVETLNFFVTPDGKHAIADSVFDFGATPFADTRKTLEARADGPARGAAGKKLLLVEFADLQCPHCKEAQPTIDNLRRDFPEARFIFQNFPLTAIHPFAFKAAAYGTCVAKKGPDAFYVYLQDVYDHQEALTAESVNQTLGNAAAKAGADAAATATCAALPETVAKVNANIKLAEDLGVSQTPMLAVNGHLIPLGGMPYETLKQVILFDAKQSDVPVASAK